MRVSPMRTLTKPRGLGDDEWSAITEAETRLRQAKSDGDGPLVIGSAKDLCEAVAKVVLAERGGSLGGAADLPDVVSAAHKALEFQPGEGIANDPETRKVAQGLKSIVLGLGELRNRRGTGHGRAAPGKVVEEHIDLAYEAAHLWGAWALRRLEPYIAGDVTALVRDLENEIFRRGDLKERLLLANVPRLPVEDQRRLGIAVARRASRETFVVLEDGIEDVDPSDPNVWPPAYIDGLLSGMFLDANGFLELAAWKTPAAERLVRLSPDPIARLKPLASSVARTAAARRGANDPAVQRSAIDELRHAAEEAAGEDLRALWLEMASALDDVGEGI